MTDEDRDTALKLLHEAGVFCTIEAKGGSWGDENMDEFLKDQPEGNSEIERWRKALSDSLGIRPMSEYDGSPIYKVVVMCTDREQLRSTEEALSERYRLVLQQVAAHSCFNGELVNRKFDKGQGVRQIAEHFGVTIEDTIGFGDSMNDLEMMETVGYSVCMENGADALKQMADKVCPSVDEDGLAKAFEELGLI